jgi:asparagine synthase (glutamine-hydrolysing)
MCGIAGYISAVSNLLPDEKELHHRGPDSNGAIDFDNVCFAHSLLRIIGDQPQPLENDRYGLTYNGELYNYDQHYANDSLWLLTMINSHGIPGIFTHLTGMFAFAVYDKVTQCIHLAVDRFAEKPLYWYADENTFAFASSPNALLHLKPKWKINRWALQSYGKLGAVMEGSIWEGIHKVPAACYVTYDIQSKKLTLTNYWQPQYQSNTSGIEDLIRQSIDNVKVADVPVYIFLSGGIDSTLVASRFKGGHAIHLDGPERSWAEMVAKKYDMMLHVVSPRKCDPVASLTDYVQKCGEPTMAGLIPYITAQEAATLCRVAVTANGADELFFGYDRTTQDVTAQQTRHIFRALPGVINVPEIDERLSRGRWLELMTYVQHDLNRTLDFASMAHSVEVRSPYLNHELVEVALSMTPEQIGRKGTLKAMLRQEGFNDVFLNRRKMGFSLYEEPKGLGGLQHSAYNWCIENSYLEYADGRTGRDTAYLSAAALGFKVWYENYKSII